MKTITLLWISAALVCAQSPDKDQTKDQSKTRRQDASQTGKSMNRRAAAGQVTPARGAGQRSVQSAQAAQSASGHIAPSHRAPSQSANSTLRQRPDAAPKTPALTEQQKASAALPTVPEGAQEVGANLFRYTDPQGKSWMYRKTPFGVSKWEDKPDAAQPAAETPSPSTTKATDLGDTVQFQRMTPFGPQKWVRKKSELTDEEKAALATAEHSGSKSADPSKPEKQ